MKLLRRLLCFGGMLAFAAGHDVSARDTVVLLHGMGRTHGSMLRLAWALERDGFDVLNLSYPSRTQTVETLAAEWLPARLATLPPDARVHFVTHSLGGIVVRQWLRNGDTRPRVGRVVMLAPPNAGSELTDALRVFALYRWATGVNGARLGTRVDDLPRALGAWPKDAGELGVIAGRAWVNPLLAAFLPQPNDGKVSVAATHLAGEHDHVVLPFSHTWLGWRAATVSEVRHFLHEGRFTAR